MLTVVGNTTVDIYVRGLTRLPNPRADGAGAPPVQTGERVLPTLGGSGAVVAYVAAALGEFVRLWSAVGADPFGELALNWLEGRKVDTASVRIMTEAGTATTVMLADAAQRRETFYYPGASGAFMPRARSVSGGLSDWLLVAGYAQLPGWRGANTLELLRNARRSGINTALDFGPTPENEPITKDELEVMLKHTNVLLCDAQELERIAGPGLAEAAQWALKAGAGAIIARQGAAGVTVFDSQAKDGEKVTASDPGVDNVTALGDSFNAGFLFERGRGASLVDSTRFGTAVASLIANAARGVLDAPDEQAARRALKD